MENPRLAFLDLAKFDGGATFRGGCLVTDGDTMPIEFRCTGAIRPTPLQQRLYGRKLIEYVCRELICLPLTKALNARPDMIFVRVPEFLKARSELGIPLLWIQEAAEGKASLRSFPGFEQEGEPAKALIASRRMRTEDLLEPFERVQNALEEAHLRKIADKEGT